MKIIGHRGASGYKPENTLASFRQALKLGVDMIEFDVYTIKTGEVVVFHDDTLDRTTNGTGPITALSFRELRKLDAGDGEKIPLLSEVLDVIDKKVPVNIELKGKGTARPVAETIRRYTTKKGWVDKLFMVSSFNHAELRTFTKLQPEIRISTLYDSLPVGTCQVIAGGGHPFSANLDAKFVTRQAVQSAHACGLEVFAYTVNSAREARRLQALKVDGIFTDYPDKILSQAAMR